VIVAAAVAVGVAVGVAGSVAASVAVAVAVGVAVSVAARVAAAVAVGMAVSVVARVAVAVAVGMAVSVVARVAVALAVGVAVAVDVAVWVARGVMVTVKVEDGLGGTVPITVAVPGAVAAAEATGPRLRVANCFGALVAPAVADGGSSPGAAPAPAPPLGRPPDGSVVMFIHSTMATCSPLTAECASRYRLCEPGGNPPGWISKRNPLLAN
jgi:hypothetical protein